VKSPVELAVGTFRTFGMSPPTLRPLLAVNRALGQDVFNPPNVKGWPGYTDWINSQTLLLRKQMLARVFRAADMAGPTEGRVEKAAMRLGQAREIDFDAGRWLDRAGGLGRAALILLPLTPDSLPEGQSVDLVSKLVLSPLYQLK
jgi:hypothetical protein